MERAAWQGNVRRRGMIARMLSRLENRIPPPILMLVCVAFAWGLAENGIGTLPSAAWLRPSGFIIAMLGLALNLVPKLQFRRSQTTVNPLAPERASHLVTGGIYRYTRNPMYLGQACLVLGWALWLQLATAFLPVAVFVVYITYLQILPEERVLSRKFPAAFEQMRHRTRRWL